MVRGLGFGLCRVQGLEGLANISNMDMYKALNSSPSADCYCMGAVPQV